MLVSRSIAPGLILAFLLGASLGASAAPIGPGLDVFAPGPTTLTIPPAQSLHSLAIGPGLPDTTVQPSPAVAPDPPTVLLLGTGLVGLGIAGRRRHIALRR
jgi:hypothetical protein